MLELFKNEAQHYSTAKLYQVMSISWLRYSQAVNLVQSSIDRMRAVNMKYVYIILYLSFNFISGHK